MNCGKPHVCLQPEEIDLQGSYRLTSGSSGLGKGPRKLEIGVQPLASSPGRLIFKAYKGRDCSTFSG